jgi:FkbM family methyltransferase
VIIDIGANKGDFILDIAAKNPTIDCLAIEPLIDLSQEIEANAKLLNLENLKVINMGIYHKRGRKYLNVSDKSDQGSSSFLEFDRELIRENQYWSLRPDLEHVAKIEVATDTLQGVLSYYNKNTPIEFIKIDVQGLDLEVLLSLGNRLKNVPLGMLEVSAVPSTRLYKEEKNFLSSCLKVLEKKNFMVYAIKPNDPASNEFNVYFGRKGINHWRLINKLGLMTNQIYAGKWYWSNPSNSI